MKWGLFDKNQPGGDRYARAAACVCAPHSGSTYLYFSGQVELVQFIYQFITEPGGGGSFTWDFVKIIKAVAGKG